VLSIIIHFTRSSEDRHVISLNCDTTFNKCSSQIKQQPLGHQHYNYVNLIHWK